MEAALSEALADLDAAADEKSIEEIKIRMLGRKGFLPAAMKEIKNVSNEEKPLIGKVANKVKTELNNKISEKLDALEDSGSAVDGIDVTIPGRQRKIGKKHLITRVIDDCVTIFRRMGFVVVDGPELEDEYHNFDALNTPADHPSRDSQDTFYLLDGRLLRTQTSPVQIRTMEKQDPPVRIVCPGRCFRRDTPDATHSMNFSQIEGLHIDTNISMADLKGTLLMFAQEMFGEDVEIRMRPHFFPFTEPSIECDVLFRNFKGGKDSWLEIFGAGMVDPNVLTNVGYDPEKVTGYAFGLGIERIAMLKYDIPDIRYLYENDIRFLEQF
ncbi:MAG: phenylalanine--tRNA ligase subunit alpha [Lentisphaeria bacterium]|nr:phenylalanine--tRNA ligase subunit alpha [Lentisphaeria bacterium]NQZ67029.1 phenylalanine--tRNA ligase subunit alpha [Lentisphaeria bacterium]